MLEMRAMHTERWRDRDRRQESTQRKDIPARKVKPLQRPHGMLERMEPGQECGE